VKSKKVLMPLALLVGLLSFLSLDAQAQPWPQKPIMLIVPFAAGGGTDAFARPLAAQLDTQLGTRVLIENRAGAGGTVGAAQASKAAPDGYTFFIGAAHHTIAPSIYPKLAYNIETDFVPIALIARPPQVVVVNPDKLRCMSPRTCRFGMSAFTASSLGGVSGRATEIAKATFMITAVMEVIYGSPFF
jgi:tripartite-type tricarboxylate transporter receptor subunit TctC